MDPQLKSATIGDGIALSYAEQGDSSGMPMLLLHGLTDSWRSFEPVMPYLPRSLRALAISQRGHGDSSRPDTYRTRDFAKDLAAFATASGCAPAVVVGHSMGSSNAIRFAIDHPDLTLGLVLVGAFATYRDNPVIVDLYESEFSRLTDPIDPAYALAFQQGTLARPVPPAYLEMVVNESLKVPARVWRAALAGLLDDDFVDELDRIRAPTLILWGDRDALVPAADANALLSSIPDSRLLVYEGAGHALHWEEPERFADELAAFARGL